MSCSHWIDIVRLVLFKVCIFDYNIQVLPSEAADNVHPGRHVFLETLVFISWGYALQLMYVEENYSLTYGQV